MTNTYAKLKDLANVPNCTLPATSRTVLAQLNSHARDASRLEHFLCVGPATSSSTSPLEQDFRRLASKLGLECYADDATADGQTLSMTGNMLVIDITFKAGSIVGCSVVLANPDGSQQELPAGQVLLDNLQQGDTTLAALNLERLARNDRLSSTYGVHLYAKQTALYEALQSDLPNTKLDGNAQVGISFIYLEAAPAANICYKATLEVEEQTPSETTAARFPEHWKQDGQWTEDGDGQANPSLRYTLVLDPPLFFIDPPSSLTAEKITLEQRHVSIYNERGERTGFDVQIDAPDLKQVSRWPISHPREVATLLQGPIRTAAVQSALLKSLDAVQTEAVQHHLTIQVKPDQFLIRSSSTDPNETAEPQEWLVRLEDGGKIVCDETRSSRILELTMNIPICLLDRRAL
ncbi:hypothetical protein BCR37DRAFT_392296 [Protomyces lactucae-debilis]|uniref:Mediator of RNA polymerase II transcription subunit 1 n=1 Tax=Protomyces lactucae-debilis TaxID=2754530 RepID=A0A1Y2FKW7_PROLT|nr:uncharacterized protein BCR37DRAFT_392296 [Protomyces lactucae-debilis]ORY83846.1 hypothetical protein BCR37DRAFT_392296 [Protomyces lactucae-debilis]